MKADITRSTYNKDKQYVKVNAQQGRVQLDADWNEQFDIQAYFDKLLLGDIVGKTGTPIEDSGFEIVPTADATSFTIGKGRYYVDGLICENNSDKIDALKQNDLPYSESLAKELFKDNVIVPKEEGCYIVYLDVWQRHITSLEDPDLLEAALGRIDTTTRTKNVWQVKTLKVETADAQGALVEFEKNIVRSDGKLRVRVKPVSQNNHGSTIESGYSGNENRLYRVEIHSPIKLANNNNSVDKNVDEGEFKPSALPDFKWSNENAIVAAKILRVKKSSDNLMHIVIENTAKDDLCSFTQDQWVEVTDDYSELWNTPGQFLQIYEVKENIQENKNSLKVKIPTPDKSLLDYIADKNGYDSKIPKIRRWNTPNYNLLNISEDTVLSCNDPSINAQVIVDKEGYVDLEEGIQVKFEAGTYVTGDYWLIPARTITKNIEWPTTTTPSNTQEPAALSSLMRHHHCPLALLQCSSSSKVDGQLQLQVISDYRKFFTALTNSLSFYYVSGDGQKITPNNVLRNILSNNPNLSIADDDDDEKVKNDSAPESLESLESNSKSAKSPLMRYTGTPLLLCVGAKIGNLPIEDKFGFFVRFKIEDTDGAGRLARVDSEEFTGKDTVIDVSFVNGYARCGWIFLSNYNESDGRKVTPDKQQVSATLMLRSEKNAVNPYPVAPIFFNATFAQTKLPATQAIATSGVVKLDLPPTTFERTGPLLSNVIFHELGSEVPPAILLSLLSSEMSDNQFDNTAVESFEDFSLYNWTNTTSSSDTKNIVFPRFKAVEVNQMSFRILVGPPFPQSDRLWYLRWWAIPAQPKTLQTATFESPLTPRPAREEIVGIYASIGAIIDNIVFVYDNGATVKIGGDGGRTTEVFKLKPNDKIISVVYTLVKFKSKNCIGKIVFKTVLGEENTYTGYVYRDIRDAVKTFTITAPEGQYIASFNAICTGTYLTTLEIAKTRKL